LSLLSTKETTMTTKKELTHNQRLSLLLDTAELEDKVIGYIKDMNLPGIKLDIDMLDMENIITDPEIVKKHMSNGTIMFHSVILIRNNTHYSKTKTAIDVHQDGTDLYCSEFGGVEKIYNPKNDLTIEQLNSEKCTACPINKEGLCAAQDYANRLAQWIK